MVNSLEQRNMIHVRDSIQLAATLIAAPTACLLRSRPQLHVAQLFDRSINLDTQQGTLISLIRAGVDPGPFSIVIDSQLPSGLPFSHLFEECGNDIVVVANERELQVGRLHIDLACAQPWDPLLTEGQLLDVHVSAGLYHIVALLERLAPQGSLPFECWLADESIIGARIRLAWREIRRAIVHEFPSLCLKGSRLAAGVGVGLTPAGDDFLVGVALALRLGINEPNPYLNELVLGATGRTGKLPMALLHAAARGEASRAWHHLLSALVEHDALALDVAVPALINVGHTSGADALFGFVVTMLTLCGTVDEHEMSLARAGFGVV